MSGPNASPKLSCTICAEVYAEWDDVWSTTCGHIYHLQCLRDWQARSMECPQCRTFNPQTHKIYLTFDDATAEEQKLSELELKLSESLAQAADLQLQLDMSEGNFLNLQAQFNGTEEKLKDLEFQRDCLLTERDSRESVLEDLFDAQNQLEQSIANGSALQQQLDESARNCQQLQHKLGMLEAYEAETLSTIGKRSDQEVNRGPLASMMRLESACLKHDKEKKLVANALQQTTTELEKEIQNRTVLSVDKMKRESRLAEVASESLTPPSVVLVSTPIDRIERVQAVAIQGFAEVETIMPPIVALTRLLEQMGMPFRKVDFLNYRWLERTLVVYFKTEEARLRFLSGKDKLLSHTDRKHMTISDFKRSNCSYSLFLHAKLLKNYGYRYVFLKNKTVFARKTKYAPDLIKIENAEQVDKMVLAASDEDKKSVQNANPEPAAKPKSANPRAVKPPNGKWQSAKTQPAKNAASEPKPVDISNLPTAVLLQQFERFLKFNLNSSS